MKPQEGRAHCISNELKGQGAGAEAAWGSILRDETGEAGMRHIIQGPVL